MQRFLFAVSFAVLTAALPTIAQQRPITAEDYARAERFLSYNTTPLVLRSGVRPNWLDDGRFWYRITTEKGSEAFLVDPVKRTKTAVRSAAVQRRTRRRSGGPARGNGSGTWRRAGSATTSPRRTANAPHSCASTISGCATLPAARRRSSRPTA